jgi:hypothetical protein
MLAQKPLPATGVPVCVTLRCYPTALLIPGVAISEPLRHRLRAIDDCVGSSRVEPGGRDLKHFGLDDMRERAEMVGRV